jgi:hypothetical protein
MSADEGEGPPGSVEVLDCRTPHGGVKMVISFYDYYGNPKSRDDPAAAWRQVIELDAEDRWVCRPSWRSRGPGGGWE